MLRFLQWPNQYFHFNVCSSLLLCPINLQQCYVCLPTHPSIHLSASPPTHPSVQPASQPAINLGIQPYIHFFIVYVKWANLYSLPALPILTTQILCYLKLPSFFLSWGFTHPGMVISLSSPSRLAMSNKYYMNQNCKLHI